MPVLVTIGRSAEMGSATDGFRSRPPGAAKSSRGCRPRGERHRDRHPHGMAPVAGRGQHWPDLPRRPGLRGLRVDRGQPVPLLPGRRLPPPGEGRRARGRRGADRACVRTRDFERRFGFERSAPAVARQVVAPAAEIVPVGGSSRDDDPAAIPHAFGTAEDVVHRDGMAVGGRVLAPASVGSAVVRLSVRRGVEAAAVAGTLEHQMVRDPGADPVIGQADDPVRAAGAEGVEVGIDEIAHRAVDDAGGAAPRRALRPGGAIAGPVVRPGMCRAHPLGRGADRLHRLGRASVAEPRERHRARRDSAPPAGTLRPSTSATHGGPSGRSAPPARSCRSSTLIGAHVQGRVGRPDPVGVARGLRSDGTSRAILPVPWPAIVRAPAPRAISRGRTPSLGGSPARRRSARSAAGRSPRATSGRNRGSRPSTLGPALRCDPRPEVRGISLPMVGGRTRRRFGRRAVGRCAVKGTSGLLGHLSAKC